ncbi:SgcJ/EcaC family oxidoreductase [Gramella sp. KN1008]|uniref:YybH family protein n=1 Tax=Gramella sp. KN1008 TaxID=2529298 RepID=UPI00103BDCC8|nr:nuclear transport factor 2 family protein [Gramella sp. KN1008]TBW28501.1 nuclear transport factor 2 family protein [Gramella sp. KN1008]
MKKQFVLLIAAVFIGLSAFAQSSNSTAREIVEENSETMVDALNDGDYETFGTYFAEDAMFKLSNINALNGRKAITAAHKPMAEQKMKLIIDTEEVLDFGDYIHEIGNYKIQTQEGQTVDQGQYSTLWKKVNDSWKIYRDVVSSSMPLPTAASGK